MEIITLSGTTTVILSVKSAVDLKRWAVYKKGVNNE